MALVSCESGSGVADVGVGACSGGKAKPCSAGARTALTPGEQKPGTGSFPFLLLSYPTPRPEEGGVVCVVSLGFKSRAKRFSAERGKGRRAPLSPPPSI